MALISMAVYDTVDNGRTEYTARTLDSLRQTVDFSRHRLFVIDNNSCAATKTLLQSMKDKMGFTLITNPENVGTANAVNMGFSFRKPGEHVIKMDNDVVIHQQGWVDIMEEVMERQPLVGVLGLKRKDLDESPYRTDFMRSRLMMVTPKKGRRWLILEACSHIMGTCTMFNSALVDRIGGLYQLDGVYAFDDSLYSLRSSVAGYINAFIHGIEIDHIDEGGNDYTKWKQQYASENMEKYHQVVRQYRDGTKDLYHPIEPVKLTNQ